MDLCRHEFSATAAREINGKMHAELTRFMTRQLEEENRNVILYALYAESAKRLSPAFQQLDVFRFKTAECSST